MNRELTAAAAIKEESTVHQPYSTYRGSKGVSSTPLQEEVAGHHVERAGGLESEHLG